MSVQILRVLGARASAPCVLAFVDDNRVRWRPETGWDCGCIVSNCDHIDRVESLIAPEVLTAVATARPPRRVR